jgi:hypothetical protein
MSENKQLAADPHVGSYDTYMSIPDEVFDSGRYIMSLTGGRWAVMLREGRRITEVPSEVSLE